MLKRFNFLSLFRTSKFQKMMCFAANLNYSLWNRIAYCTIKTRMNEGKPQIQPSVGITSIPHNIRSSPSGSAAITTLSWNTQNFSKRRLETIKIRKRTYFCTINCVHAYVAIWHKEKPFSHAKLGNWNLVGTNTHYARLGRCLPYLQLELGEQSQQAMLITHKGLFRNKRLLFGINLFSTSDGQDDTRGGRFPVIWKTTS